jgi:hypothetical protein
MFLYKCSHQYATCPYSKPNASIPHYLILFSRPIQYYPPPSKQKSAHISSPIACYATYPGKLISHFHSFHSHADFYSAELLAPCPTPSWTITSVHDILLNIFTYTSKCNAISFIRAQVKDPLKLFWGGSKNSKSEQLHVLKDNLTQQFKLG